MKGMGYDDNCFVIVRESLTKEVTFGMRPEDKEAMRAPAIRVFLAKRATS